MRVRRGATLLVTAAVALCACSGEQSSTEALQQRFGGRCDIDADDSERTDAIGILAMVEEWWLVSSVPADDPGDDASGTVEIESEAAAVDSLTRTGPVSPAALMIHSSYLAGLRWATDPLAPGASAYVGVAPYGGVDPASPDDDLPFTVTVMLRLDDGSYVFPGQCMSRFLADPLRERYGSRTTEVLDAAIGTTGDDLLSALEA